MPVVVEIAYGTTTIIQASIRSGAELTSEQRETLDSEINKALGKTKIVVGNVSAVIETNLTAKSVNCSGMMVEPLNNKSIRVTLPPTEKGRILLKDKNLATVCNLRVRRE